MGQPYRYDYGPEQLTTQRLGTQGRLDALQEGNCQLFFHVFYEHKFGVYLPEGLLSLEMYTDRTLFRDVPVDLVNPDVSQLVEGDVFLLGMAGLKNFRKLHIAVYAGLDDKAELMLAHSSSRTKGSAMTSLSDLRGYVDSEGRKVYEQLYAVRRLREDLFVHHVEPVIGAQR